MELLTQASRHYQQTILMITHNRNLTASVDRVFQVADGVLTVREILEDKLGTGQLVGRF